MTGSHGDLADLSAELAAVDADLIRLHGSREIAKLSCLHEKAAALLDDAGARRFHLTHAWVYALECGDKDRANRLARVILSVNGS